MRIPLKYPINVNVSGDKVHPGSKSLLQKPLFFEEEAGVLSVHTVTHFFDMAFQCDVLHTLFYCSRHLACDLDIRMDITGSP